jgi:hypothetical protein
MLGLQGDCQGGEHVVVGKMLPRTILLQQLPDKFSDRIIWQCPIA